MQRVSYPYTVNSKLLWAFLLIKNLFLLDVIYLSITLDVTVFYALGKHLVFS